ncbi:hypothetical protein G3N30_06035 [Microbacterium lacticum]|uniref:hypothetical protein n=1 Tax=Microbacterium lacticum TaxID=33885 RepID=UPI0018B06D49|nr:hypothetical protein [Microbacterium lacticum]MBF9335809.1 hypothetical protein [Microbacterium lacticum]
MDISIDRIVDSTSAIATELVQEEVSRQGVSEQTRREATRIAIESVLDRLNQIAEDMCLLDEGTDLVEDDLALEALATSTVFQDDVLARVVAGFERTSCIPHLAEREVGAYIERFGVDWKRKPGLLYAQAAQLSVGARATALSIVWSHSQPRHLPMPKWRSLFDSVGFIHDGARVSRPESVPTLYRAATPGYERNWSWTDSRAVANWFLNYIPGSELYALENVDPSGVLARIDLIAENEWVVDVRASGATPTLVTA